MHVKYKLVGRDGKMLGPQREAAGNTSFFVGTGETNQPNTKLGTILADVTTDERQALPLAAEELATRLVSELSEGW
jgi:hypothetical protein